MAQISISPETLAKVRNYINDITPPGEGVTGSPLVDQSVAALFGEAGATKEVQLVKVSFDNAPTARFKMVGAAKDIAQDTGKFQLRGRATIIVEGITTDVMMHAHTAASFAQSDKVMLRGRSGTITNGQNKDKFWLSLSPEVTPTAAELLAYLESATTPAVNP